MNMKTKLMINCEEAARLLSDKLEHPLPLYKRILLKMHIAMCGACCLYGKQIAALKDLVARRSKDDYELFPPLKSSLSDETCERMKSLLKKNNS